MTRKTAFFVAILFAIVHVIFAGLYASVTPYRTSGILLGQRGPDGPAQVPDIGAPDERQHANYVKHLLDGKGFPVLDPRDPQLGENYQAHQPPLYYLLEAGWVKLTGTDLNSPDDGLKARFLNALIGAGTVLGAFFLGLWGFKREDVGLLAAAFVALLPMNCALSGAVSNDPLLYCLCAWTLALTAYSLNHGWTLRTAVLVGALSGLAVLTKTTGIALLPILLLAIFLSSPRPGGKTIGVAVASFLVIALPWLLRNKSLYGDFFAMGAFKEAFVNSPKAAMFIDGFGAFEYWSNYVGWWTARSFFGVFGYMDVFMNEKGTPYTGPGGPNTLYRLLLAIFVGIVLSWLVTLKKPEWKENARSQTLVASFIVIVILLFAMFNAQYFQGQARYLFPAIAPLGVVAGIGLLNLFRNNWKVALGIWGLALLLLNFYALTRLPAEFLRRTIPTSAQIVLPIESTTIVGPSLPVSNRRLFFDV